MLNILVLGKGWPEGGPGTYDFGLPHIVCLQIHFPLACPLLLVCVCLLPRRWLTVDSFSSRFPLAPNSFLCDHTSLQRKPNAESKLPNLSSSSGRRVPHRTVQAVLGKHTGPLNPGAASPACHGAYQSKGDQSHCWRKGLYSSGSRKRKCLFFLCQGKHRFSVVAEEPCCTDWQALPRVMPPAQSELTLGKVLDFLSVTLSKHFVSPPLILL